MNSNQRVAGRRWCIIRHPLASLHCTQNTVIIPPPHAGHL